MKVLFVDNDEIIDFESITEVINYMRESSPHINSVSNSEYMLGYARRSVIAHNQDIRAINESCFFEDLIKHKHIKIITNMSVN